MASGKLADQIWGLAVFISTIFPVPISDLTYIDSICNDLNCLAHALKKQTTQNQKTMSRWKA